MKLPTAGFFLIGVVLNSADFYTEKDPLLLEGHSGLLN